MTHRWKVFDTDLHVRKPMVLVKTFNMFFSLPHESQSTLTNFSKAAETHEESSSKTFD